MTKSYTIEQLSGWHQRLTFDGPLDAALTQSLIRVVTALQGKVGVEDVLHGYRTIVIESTLALEEIRRYVDAAAEDKTEPNRSQPLVVTYDGEDLTWVAEHLGLSQEEVIERHVGIYHVVALGSPGFTYLSTTSGLAVPRLQTPRHSVPAGAVGLAGIQTGIYGKERPGGWRIIGTCAVPDMKPGDQIHISAA